MPGTKISTLLGLGRGYSFLQLRLYVLDVGTILRNWKTWHVKELFILEIAFSIDLVFGCMCLIAFENKL